MHKVKMLFKSSETYIIFRKKERERNKIEKYDDFDDYDCDWRVFLMRR